MGGTPDGGARPPPSETDRAHRRRGLGTGGVSRPVTPSDPTGKVPSSSAVDEGELRVLMHAYQAGAIEAFDSLHARLAMPLFHYLAAITRDRAHAQDLLQETFL